MSDKQSSTILPRTEESELRCPNCGLPFVVEYFDEGVHETYHLVPFFQGEEDGICDGCGAVLKYKDYEGKVDLMLRVPLDIPAIKKRLPGIEIWPANEQE